MQKDIIAQKRTIAFTWGVLTLSEASTVAQLCKNKGAAVRLTYPDVLTAKITTGSFSAAKTQQANVFYQVFCCGRWQPEVKNINDYAGVENVPAMGIYARVPGAHIKYRVHTIGVVWLPWVTDREDFAGWGSLNKSIDCVQATLVGMPGYEIEYRVSTAKSKSYLPWVRGWNDKTEDGYAGIYGVAVDKLQIRIVKK